MEKTSIQLLKQFFEPPALTMNELKALSVGDREELADGVAAHYGLKKITKDGKNLYVA